MITYNNKKKDVFFFQRLNDAERHLNTEILLTVLIKPIEK